jgi:hypothetical protein
MGDIDVLLKEAMTDEHFRQTVREAAQSVEDELAAEDKGWLNLSSSSALGVEDSTRITAVKTARTSFYTDPMAKQAIRLWTDYSFGEGLTFKTNDEAASEALDAFFDAPENRAILGSRGQRKSSDKLLVDGEIFFVLFIGPDLVQIRTIDPLEITEIITDPDDIENPMFYRRDWMDRQGKQHTSYYRSTNNEENKATPDSAGKEQQATTDAKDSMVYHLALNTLGQRGTPLLLPAQFYLKYQKKFLAARISIMLALTRFAWKNKIQGGASAAATAKAAFQDKTPAAGSVVVENQSSNLEPIRTDTGSAQAYQDGRMIKLMICAAVGWPEQYFGDLSTGNLATAKTVELPVAKMCGSYQKIWSDAYQDICEIVLKNAGVSEENWYIDFDFPAITPLDAVAAAQTMQAMSAVFPIFSDSRDIMQAALVSMGINNPGEVLDELEKLKKKKDEEAAAKKALMPPEMQAVANGEQPPPKPGEVPPAPGEIPAQLKQKESTVARLINSLRSFKAMLLEESKNGHGNGTDDKEEV